MTLSACISLPVQVPASDEAPRPKSVTRVSMTRPFPVLLRETADAFGVSVDEIQNKKDRHKTVAAARHTAIWVARELWDFSFPELGRLLGNMDHTTMISACKRIEREIEKDSRVGRLALELRGEEEAAAGE